MTATIQLDRAQEIWLRSEACRRGVPDDRTDLFVRLWLQEVAPVVIRQAIERVLGPAGLTRQGNASADEVEQKLQQLTERVMAHPDDTAVPENCTLTIQIQVPEAPDLEREHDLRELEGLGAELWQGIDAHDYVRGLRSEWDHRP